MQTCLLVLLCLSLILATIYSLKKYFKYQKYYDLAAKIPGPFAFPIIGSAYLLIGPRKSVVDKLAKLVDKYKKPWKLWLGSDLVVVISNPEDIDIVVNKALDKPDSYSFVNPVLKEGLFSSNGERWRKHRKLVSSTFSITILNSFVEAFTKHSDILAKRLENVADGRLFDAFPMLSQSALEMFCEAALGQKTTTFQQPFMQLFSRGMDLVYYRMANYIWSYFDIFWELTPQHKQLMHISKDLDQFVRKIVEAKRQEYRRNKNEIFNDGTERKAFLDHVIESCEESDNGWTDEEIVQEAQTVVAAGGESIGSTASFVLLMLGLHPEIQKTVLREVEDILGDDQVTFEHLPKMKYLEQVIKETLRLFPVASLVGRYVSENIELKDCTIPAGGSCVIAFVHTHRNPELYEQPNVFNPERFSAENSTKRHPYAYLPFSGGPRNCVGLKYAMMVVKTMVATVVRKYEITSGYRSIDDIELTQQIVIKCVDGYNLALKHRNK